MTADKKRLYIISGTILAALLFALFAPAGSGRILAAILLLPGAAACWFFLKKRPVLSINTQMVLLLISVMGLMYVVLYYISGLAFGFTKIVYGVRLQVIARYVIPIAAIIAGTEITRFVLCAQPGKWGKVFAYFICLVADILIQGSIADVHSFASFMDMVALRLFPGLLYNLLFNYLTVRYGFLPNIIYRALTVWVFYLIPYGSAVSDGILAIVNLFLPIAIYYFIDSLYERKKRYALGIPNRFVLFLSRVLTVIVVVIMIGTVMLVSNQFSYGSFVIATGSMTGELNKGDVAIFEKYEDQPLQEGQVIVFTQNKSMVVHRIVDIQIINEKVRYYTKGDANEDMDAGWRTSGDIVGLVNYKLPYLGFPTLWLRSLFNR